MVAVPVEFLIDIAASHIETRNPRGGGGGYVNNGAAGRAADKLAREVTIGLVFVFFWTMFFIWCWKHCYGEVKWKGESYPLLKSCGSALLLALLITPAIWLFQKIMGKLGKGSYTQVDEDKMRPVNAPADTGDHSRRGKQGGSKYEPMGYRNAAPPSPAPLALSPMTSRAPSPAPPTALPPPAHGPRSVALHAPTPYDPVSHR